MDCRKMYVLAAVLTSAAYAAGCGNGNPQMMVEPEDSGPITPGDDAGPITPPEDGGTTPTDSGGTLTHCSPTVEDPTASRCEVCDCPGSSDVTDFLAEHPEAQPALDSMTYCRSGETNRCNLAGINFPVEMHTFAPFNCAEFVNNDLWASEVPDVTQGSPAYPGEEGVFTADFAWAPGGSSAYSCQDHTCYSACGVASRPEYLGDHATQTFTPDCLHVTTELFHRSETTPYATLTYGWAEPCGDGQGECL